MERILITGANGLLGQALIKTLSPFYNILATGNQLHPSFSASRAPYRRLDLSDARACMNLMAEFQPQVIINAGAFTDVDGCEAQREKCWRVNVKGVENLILAARSRNTSVVQISTDYLFDGQSGPYDESAVPKPLCYYAKSKLASENILAASGIDYAIVRTSVVYGIGRSLKNNFFLWLYHCLKSGKTVRIVDDQYNTPTLAEDLATGIKLLIAKNAAGIYNISGPDYMSRLEYALLLADVFGFERSLIRAIRTGELKQAAQRPLNAGLKIEKARRDLDYRPHTTAGAFRWLKERLSERES